MKEQIHGVGKTFPRERINGYIIIIIIVIIIIIIISKIAAEAAAKHFQKFILYFSVVEQYLNHIAYII